MKLIKRWWAWQKKFLKGLWLVVTSMGNWKGVTSLIIVWLILSGIGVAIVFRRGKDIITYDLRSDRISVKGVLEPKVEQLVERLRENKGDLGS